MKRSRKIQIGLSLFCLALVFCVSYAFGQQSLQQVEQEVTTQLSTGRKIVKGVIDFIFALGAVGVIYAFVSKRDDAKNWLISYFVAIIVWGVIRTMFFTGV